MLTAEGRLPHWELAVKSVRRLGILGGMSWASSLKYYELINLEILKLTEGARSGDIVMWSFDTTLIEPLIAVDDWKAIGRKLQEATDKLLLCGAEGIIIASNTIHEAVDRKLLKLPVPFLDIRDSLLGELHDQAIGRIGLLGTSSAMGGELWRKLSDGPAGIEVLLPPQSLWAAIDDMIFNSLCRGECSARDLDLARQIFDLFAERGMRHVVLGCTELGLLPVETPGITVLDTTAIHARDASRWSAAPVLAPVQSVLSTS
jgi:aspartate racemase